MDTRIDWYGGSVLELIRDTVHAPGNGTAASKLRGQLTDQLRHAANQLPLTTIQLKYHLLQIQHVLLDGGEFRIGLLVDCDEFRVDAFVASEKVFFADFLGPCRCRSRRSFLRRGGLGDRGR